MTPGAGAPALRHNLGLMLAERRAEDAGDRVALRAGDVEWTYAELARRTRAAAAWWAERGLRRGSTALLVLPDGPEWVAMFLGAQRAGIVCALASPALPAERLRDATARLRPAAILAGDAGAQQARTATDGDAAAPTPAPVRADDIAYLLLTSGSTGPAKWAPHRAGDIAACIATYGRRVLRLRPGDTTWSAAALPTSYGLGNSCYFPLGAGATASLAGADRSPSATADACRQHGANVLLGVPTSWARLARHVAEGRVDGSLFARVRLAVSAGEHLPASVWREVRRTTGLRLVNGLGSSELTNLYLSDRPGNPRPGTVGWPVPGYRVRVASGDEGELLVRGPTLMAGDGVTDADGWFHTGDVVRREADGSHTYIRRMGDRFKSGGLWVDAAQVEEALRADRTVTRAVVLPVRDREGLQRVGAMVEVPTGNREMAQRRLETLARRGLRPSEVPRALVVVPALPSTASGKADRAAIRRRLAQELDHPDRQMETAR